MPDKKLPLLFTFDGQARSGKGTIIHAIKRDLLGRNVNAMLVDTGQIFRVLAVFAVNHGVDVDSPDKLNVFLSNETMLTEATQFIKDVYHMDHAHRDALIYTNEVSENSAKLGARPKSQEFKDKLILKWMKDAGIEGVEVVLMDGRAMRPTGEMLLAKGLCDYRMGFYFLCDPLMGARRTLGYADIPYERLGDTEREEVDRLVVQVAARNKADMERAVQPLKEPENAPKFELPKLDYEPKNDGLEMIIIDTSADITKEDMTEPFIRLFEKIIKK